MNRPQIARLLAVGFAFLAALTLERTARAADLYPPMQPPWRKLVSRGQPKGAIVLAATATALEQHAATELVRYIQDISGATLTISCRATPANCSIFLGAAARARLDWSKLGPGLGDDGFVLRTVPEGWAIGKPFAGLSPAQTTAWERARTEAASIGEAKIAALRPFLEARGRRFPASLIVHAHPERIYGVGQPPRRPTE